MRESLSSAQDIWQQVLIALRKDKRVARPSFQSSIKQVQPKAITDTRLELIVATEFFDSYLQVE